MAFHSRDLEYFPPLKFTTLKIWVNRSEWNDLGFKSNYAQITLETCLGRGIYGNFQIHLLIQNSDVWLQKKYFVVESHFYVQARGLHHFRVVELKKNSDCVPCSETPLLSPHTKLPSFQWKLFSGTSYTWWGGLMSVNMWYRVLS